MEDFAQVGRATIPEGDVEERRGRKTTELTPQQKANIEEAKKLARKQGREAKSRKALAAAFKGGDFRKPEYKNRGLETEAILEAF